jgi:hypothetical protein
MAIGKPFHAIRKARIHRTSYAEVAARAKRVANALQLMGHKRQRLL